MKDPKNGKVSCVICLDQVPSVDVKVQKSKKDEDIVKSLGDYLLKGWTMMEKPCNRCEVPLMRSLEGDELCVSCFSAVEKVPLKNESNSCDPLQDSINILQDIFLERAKNLKYQELDCLETSIRVLDNLLNVISKTKTILKQ